MPRLRASSARWNFVALPPPERGFMKRTGCFGRWARGRSARLANADPAAPTATATPATTSTLSSTPFWTISSTTAPARSIAIAPRPASRATPRRRSPYHPSATASARHASTTSAWGKLATAAPIANRAVVTANARAAMAERRRLVIRCPPDDLAQGRGAGGRRGVRGCRADAYALARRRHAQAVACSELLAPVDRGSGAPRVGRWRAGTARGKARPRFRGAHLGDRQPAREA